MISDCLKVLNDYAYQRHIKATNPNIVYLGYDDLRERAYCCLWDLKRMGLSVKYDKRLHVYHL